MLMDFIQMIGQLFPKKSLHVTFPRHFYRFWNEHTMFGSYDRQYSACCITIYLTYLDNFERWVDSFVFFLSDKWSIFSIWCMYNMYLNGWVLYIVLNINMLFQDLEGVSEFDQRSSSAFSSLRQSPKTVILVFRMLVSSPSSCICLLCLTNLAQKHGFVGYI